MSPTQLQKFKNSLAIVATKSTPGADHYENLNTVISRLEDEDLVVPKKDLIVDLLKHIT